MTVTRQPFHEGKDGFIVAYSFWKSAEKLPEGGGGQFKVNREERDAQEKRAHFHIWEKVSDTAGMANQSAAAICCYSKFTSLYLMFPSSD